CGERDPGRRRANGGLACRSRFEGFGSSVHHPAAAGARSNPRIATSAMSSEAAQRLAEARRELEQARQYLARSRAAVSTSATVVQGLSRADLDNTLAAAVSQHQSKRDVLQAAVTREQQALAAVNRALSEFLDTDAETTEIDSLSASFPIVLLPVRLET